MPPRDPGKSQLDFPLLLADLIRELKLLGAPIGLLDFVPSVQPVYIVSARGGALDVTAAPPIWTSSEIFDGSAASPAAATVIVDTGQLEAGDFDITATVSNVGQNGVSSGEIQLQLRDAANAATIAVPITLPTTQLNVFGSITLPIAGIQIAENERLRIQVITTAMTGMVSGVIMAKRRVTP